jgi:hypothetical protein
MARYLTKKRRNIKKYKKSRKGHRRKGRSVKRHTVGKRRRMVGGDVFTDKFNFNVTADDLNFVIGKNQSYASKFRQSESDKKAVFDKIELVAYGIALVTNRSIGKFLRTDNRKEQINVFACYLQPNTNEPFCYAILRCANTYCFDSGKHDVVIPNFEMDEKILFLFVKEQQTQIQIMSSGAKKIPDEVVKGTAYNTFQFTNRISSDDLYKILVPEIEDNEANLKLFFDAVKQGINFIEKKEYYNELDHVIKEDNIKSLRDRQTSRTSGARDAAGLGLGFLVGI